MGENPHPSCPYRWGSVKFQYTVLCIGIGRMLKAICFLFVHPVVFIQEIAKLITLTFFKLNGGAESSLFQGFHRMALGVPVIKTTHHRGGFGTACCLLSSLKVTLQTDLLFKNFLVMLIAFRVLFFRAQSKPFLSIDARENEVFIHYRTLLGNASLLVYIIASDFKLKGPPLSVCLPIIR